MFEMLLEVEELLQSGKSSSFQLATQLELVAFLPAQMERPHNKLGMGKILRTV